MSNTYFIKGSIIGLAVGLFFGWLIFSSNGENKSLKNLSSFSESSATVLDSRGENIEVDENHKKYSNSTFGFSLVYPKELSVTEYDEPGGAKTIVFQKGEEMYGFQIFVTPYEKKEITKERIKSDIPSGIIKDPIEVVIGEGINALAFLSSNTAMGETREVWFIKDGNLFEVTTYKAQDSWLADILKTISFPK